MPEHYQLNEASRSSLSQCSTALFAWSILGWVGGPAIKSESAIAVSYRASVRCPSLKNIVAGVAARMASRRIVIVALLSGAVDCVSTAAFAATAAFSSSSMLSIVQKRIVPTPSSDQARKRYRPLSINHLPPGDDLARSAAVRTSR